MSAQTYCPNCDIVYSMAHECCPLCMLKQVSGELCDKCGWAMKFPEELCRCELEEENKRLRELLAEAIHALQGVAEYDTDPDKSWTITKETCRDSLENIAVGLKELEHERE